MSEEFIEEGRSTGSPFVVLAGILGAIFILAVVCIAAVLLTRGNQDTVDPATEATSIAVVATNEAVMTQNAFVTQTLIARTMTAAAPTSTPIPSATATNTPLPTFTNTPLPTATETPVVIPGEDEGDGDGTDGDADGDGTPDATNPTPTTSIFGTPIFGGGTTSTPVPSTGGTGGSGGTGGTGTLPQTGFSLWGIIGLGAGLLALAVLARRLRAN
ncbi:MAG: hypothetical protein KA314_03090 [Chloroflexi bacterium]|nr:hypothetical protein [Chloroflexota bacterium]MBP8054796.1 hypothetical protein [Chloroflexota bacterium]